MKSEMKKMWNKRRWNATHLKDSSITTNMHYYEDKIVLFLDTTKELQITTDTTKLKHKLHCVLLFPIFFFNLRPSCDKLNNSTRNYA
jgi:hypothetical protein